jgi:hypothetical protein
MTRTYMCMSVQDGVILARISKPFTSFYKYIHTDIQMDRLTENKLKQKKYYRTYGHVYKIMKWTFRTLDV